MSLEIEITFDNIDEFIYAFGVLPDNIQSRVNHQLIKWCSLVREHARRTAPKRTGWMASLIFAEVKDLVAIVGSDAFYALFVEMGTRYMRAQPFIWPALQRYLPLLEDMMIEAVEEAKYELAIVS